MATTPNSKADALNDYFKSVFTTDHEDLSSMPVMPDSPHPNMQDIDIIALGVAICSAFQNKPTKTTGPDDIPTRVLKKQHM